MIEPRRSFEAGGSSSPLSHRPSGNLEREGSRRSSSRPCGDELGSGENVTTDATSDLELEGRTEEGGSREPREKGGALVLWGGHRRPRTRHYTVELSDVVHRFVASRDDHPRVTAHSEATYPPYSPHCAAQVLLERHGERAVVYAAKELADCQASGDGDGYAEWGEISDAIEELQRASGDQG